MPFYIWSHFQSWQTQSRLSFFVHCLKRCRGSPPQLTSRMIRCVVTSSIITGKGLQIPTSIWMSLSHRCWSEPDVIKTQVCCRIIWSGTASQLYSLPPTKKVISRFFFAGGKEEWLTEINNNIDKNSGYMILLKPTLMICSCTPSSVCVPWKQLQIVSTNRSISLLPGILLSRALPVIWPYAMSFYKWQILPKKEAR